MSGNGTYTVTQADDRCMVATLGALIVPIVGKDGYTVASAQAQAKAIEAHGRSLGRGRMVEVSIIDAAVPIPDADLRAALDENVPVVAPYYAAVSAVFAGTGFRGAVVRGIIASFQLLSRTPFPQKVFSTIDEAADFAYPYLAALGDPARDRAALAASLSAICADAAGRKLLSSDTLRTVRGPLRARA